MSNNIDSQETLKLSNNQVGTSVDAFSKGFQQYLEMLGLPSQYEPLVPGT